MSSLALTSAQVAESNLSSVNTLDLLAPFTSLFFNKKIKKIAVKEHLAVQLALLLVRITRSAFDCFKTDQFTKFDALVGETSCQLRAAKLRLLHPAILGEAQNC